jgi:membrane fusion protein (multidrug efflux system)
VGKNDATLLATVSSIDPIRVDLSISETEYLKLMALRKKGQSRGPAPLELMLADGSVYPHKGQVVIADRAVDLKTGTLTILSEFPNPEGLLRPGQFGRIRVAAEVAENVVLVPQKAVMEVQGTKSVLVVGADNVVTMRTISLGESAGDLSIVRDGLKAGERVIVDGLQKARPGSPVNPTAAPEKTPGPPPEAKGPEKSAEAAPAKKAGGK